MYNSNNLQCLNFTIQMTTDEFILGLLSLRTKTGTYKSRRCSRDPPDLSPKIIHHANPKFLINFFSSFFGHDCEKVSTAICGHVLTMVPLGLPRIGASYATMQFIGVWIIGRGTSLIFGNILQQSNEQYFLHSQ